MLENKNIGLVSNSSSILRNSEKSVHILDTLIKLNQKIRAVFAPEHGFLSNKENGAFVDNYFDSDRKVDIYSIYGKNKKPNPEQLKDINLMIFDCKMLELGFTLTYQHSISQWKLVQKIKYR